jgi:cytochrome P450
VTKLEDAVPVVDLDHHSPDFAENAEAILRELRERAPVAWSTMYDGFWVVTGYEGNHEVLKHPEVFTSARWPTDTGMGAIAIPQTPSPLMLPLEVDPPVHSGVRGLLNPLLSPRATQQLAPRIAHWVKHHIDNIIEAGEGDLLYDVTGPVPVSVTVEWLGYPWERAREAANAVHQSVGFPDGSPEKTQGIEGLMKMVMDLVEVVQQRRVDPRDDAISALVSSELDGEPVDDDTVVGLCMTLIAGGVDTTTSLTASALVHLQRDRELRQRLIDEPDLLVPATEEFLRWYAPVTSIARTVTQDAQLGGCPVHAGDRVLVCRDSANFDPAQFEDPEEFIPDRFPNRHVSFGLGPHRCVGSHIGRLMFQEMITQILARMPDYEIDLGALRQYPDRSFVQGWVSLPARFTPGTR